MHFRTGDVYEWVASPAGPHMYIVLSDDRIHHGCSTFMGVLVSSRRFQRDKNTDYRVVLDPSDCPAFSVPCLAYGEQVTSVPIRAFGPHPECLGNVSHRMGEIISAVGSAMCATCLGSALDYDAL